MRDAQACAICGAAVLDMDLHARFHGAIDTIDRTASDAAAEAGEALEKPDHASNILYQRGID